MGNRKQPFGYKITLGEVVIHTEEAKVVQLIFNQYLTGESLQKLADILQKHGVAYDEGRSWNKNTIARILEDNRYAGEKGYPKLIDPEQLRAVAEKRAQKAAPPQKTELQKVLRKLCTKSISSSSENARLYWNKRTKPNAIKPSFSPNNPADQSDFGPVPEDASR